MNEFVSKKLAEVQAFILLADNIVVRGGEPFAHQASDVRAQLQALHGNLESLITDADLKDVFRAKRDRTQNKVTQMMELYVGDSWDNPVEVLEWLSFYSGSASAHAALVSSCLNALSLDSEAQQLAKISEDFWQILIAIKQRLGAIGVERVTQ